MKKHILIVIFLLSLMLNATIVAELDQTACVDTDYLYEYIHLDNQNIINLYHYHQTPGFDDAQKLWVKRIHPDGTEEEPYLLFDFNDPANLGDRFHHITHKMHTEDGTLLVFWSLTHIVVLSIEGTEVEPYVIAKSEVDDPESWYSFPFSGGNLLIVAKNEDNEHKIWKWNYQSGECSHYYDVPDLFDVTWITMFGDTMVFSEGRVYDAQGTAPVLVVESDLNTTQHQAYQYRIEAQYMLDGETSYARWVEDQVDYIGIIHIGNNNFTAEYWTSNVDIDAMSESYVFTLSLPDSIYGAWYRWRNSAEPYGDDSYRNDGYEDHHIFRLYELLPNGVVADYSGFPHISTDQNNYFGALKIDDKLLLIQNDEETYTFELADIEASQYIEFMVDTWQPDLDGNSSLQTLFYNTDDCIVIRMLMTDMDRSLFMRFYFLNLSQRVSTSDLVQPVPTLSAYPNPFIESVQISSSKKEGEAVLDIYNLKGQKVKSIKTRDAKYVWDGKDEKGNSLGAGIYFIREDAATKPVKIIKIKP
ncbi:MAG TPA: T9SS type A sorting domain-containing protein [Candidatus Cloacimonetes bacterium]|nr:T9SS type A sorting domain-containing protein [Candidatus Cloacimonadota bacterium]